MRRVQPSRRPFVRIAGALLLATLVMAVPPSSPALPASTRMASAQALSPGAGIEATTLATRRLDEVPAGRRWVLRRGHPLNDDAHAHAGGFVYAATGPSYLVVADSQGSLMQEGQAAWAPGGIGHLHATPFRASNRAAAASADETEIWTLLLETEIESRRPGAAAISPPFVRVPPGPHEARLVALTFQPGATTELRSRIGPELAYPLSGAWELEYAGVQFSLGAGDGYLADPGVPHRLRNVGEAPARLLSAQLVPVGQPSELPASRHPP